MKMNESGQYDVGDGNDMFIEDVETGEKIVFLLDPNEKLVVRSLLEEDIQPVTVILDVTSSERRKYRRILYNEVPKPGSQEKIFVAEKIIGDNSENIYEKDRELIGLGIRDEEEIQMTVCKNEEMSKAILKMIMVIGKHYGIEGIARYTPAQSHKKF